MYSLPRFKPEKINRKEPWRRKRFFPLGGFLVDEEQRRYVPASPLCQETRGESVGLFELLVPPRKDFPQIDDYLVLQDWKGDTRYTGRLLRIETTKRGKTGLVFLTVDINHLEWPFTDVDRL